MKPCLICGQNKEDKDIVLDGTLSSAAMITDKQHIYVCYSCLSMVSEVGKTIVLSIDGIALPNIKKWSIDKDFVNPQSVIK